MAGGALGAVVATTAKRSRASSVTQSPVVGTPPVVFEITSEPSGATVLSGNQSVGVTPLRLSRPREDAAPVRLRLALLLQGYETAVIAVEGKDELVPVHQVLAPNPLLTGRHVGSTMRPPLPNAATTPEATAPATGTAVWAMPAGWMMPPAADGRALATPEAPAVGTTRPTDVAPHAGEPPAKRLAERPLAIAPRGSTVPASRATTRPKLAPPTVKSPAQTEKHEAAPPAYRADPYEQ
jgi:hypothetical protein